MIARSDIPGLNSMGWCKVHDRYFIPRNGCRGVGCEPSDWRFPGVDAPTLNTLPRIPANGKPGGDVEEALYLALEAAGYVCWRDFIPQAAFACRPPYSRGWQADVLFPAHKLAVEIDGGVHAVRGMMKKDAEKGTAYATLGYRVVRLQPAQVKSGEAVGLIQRAMEGA